MPVLLAAAFGEFLFVCWTLIVTSSGVNVLSGRLIDEEFGLPNLSCCSFSFGVQALGFRGSCGLLSAWIERGDGVLPNLVVFPAISFWVFGSVISRERGVEIVLGLGVIMKLAS